MTVIKILAFALVLAGSLPAYGGAKENAARAEYEEGTTAYNLGHFEEATQHYEAAYKLVHDPNMLFNIAQSYRRAGKAEQALAVFRNYLRESPANAPNRQLAERFVEELKRKSEESQAAAARNAAETEPPVEPKPVLTPPGAPPPGAAPFPQSSQGATVAGTSAPADLLGQNASPPSESAAERRPFYKAWWFWTAVGTAVAAGVVTAFLLARPAPDACDGLGMKCVGVK